MYMPDFAQFALQLFTMSIVLFAFVILGLIAHAIYCCMLPQEHRPTEPACGECFYAVAGNDSLRCPECGSDLRQVGIILPKGRGQLRTTLLVGLIAWTAICGSMVFTFLAVSRGLEAGLLPTSIIWAAGATFIIWRRGRNQRRIRAKTVRYSQPLPLSP